MNKFKEMKNKIKNKRGFTLIELIVVMAVIGILVLLAAPRFLGYTKDANVSAMKADAKVLSNISLVYNVEKEAWPVVVDVDGDATAATITDADLLTNLEGALVYQLDEAKISSQYKSLKNDLADYGLIIDGTREGEVVHLEGVFDREGLEHFNESIKLIDTDK